MFTHPGVSHRRGRQRLAARRALATVLQVRAPHLAGLAGRFCDDWQRRFETALRSDIPDWVGLAGLRCITDFVILRADVPKRFPPTQDVKQELCTSPIEAAEQAWRGYTQSFALEFPGLNPQGGATPVTLGSAGKLDLAVGGAAERHFLGVLDACRPVLGGQAGNIAWLWTCIGARRAIYVPYLPDRLVSLTRHVRDLADLTVLYFEGGEPARNLLGHCQAGVRSGTGFAPAPSGGAIAMPYRGRRLIYSFKGLRELRRGAVPPWDQVQFFRRGPLGEAPLGAPLVRAADEPTWPNIPVFAETFVDTTTKTLQITVVDEAALVDAVVSGGQADGQGQPRIDLAILGGGLDQLFTDSWLTRDSTLQAILREILVEQLGALARLGVRIGIELSGTPPVEYLQLLQQLCRAGVIVALGVNGEDELPGIVGSASRSAGLEEFWLDPSSQPQPIAAQIAKEGDEGDKGDYFAYVTYLRAKQLAAATGVRTLFVHTNGIDLILRRDADPGALVHAQRADMMAKGLVIAALLQRDYGERWLDEVGGLIPAVTPDAMAQLGRFAYDFEQRERVPGAAERLLKSGYWIAPSPEQYSVAAVPVLWPNVSDKEVAAALPEDQNATGAGDMTFGAFMFLASP